MGTSGQRDKTGTGLACKLMVPTLTSSLAEVALKQHVVEEYPPQVVKAYFHKSITHVLAELLTT